MLSVSGGMLKKRYQDGVGESLARLGCWLARDEGDFR